jgi:2-polyprenyl-3-methyl-5-hydroxy-6-metoxy-1,4-benzoquinol methylase
LKINLLNRNCPICLNNIEAINKIIPELNPEINNELIKKYWSSAVNSNKSIFFPYSRCKCGLLYNKVYPDDRSLNSLYSNQNDNVISGDILLDLKTKEEYLNSIDKILFKSTKKIKILEVGADNGSFLKLIKKRHNDSELYAIEPNTNMHKELKKITKKKFSDISEIDKEIKFDLIIAIHVFDHIPDLNKYFQKLNSFLNPEGSVFGVVHNEKSLMSKILGNRWPAYTLQHPHLFNHESVNIFFRSFGFNKLFIKRTKNFFSLDFLLKHLVKAIFKKTIKFPKLFSVGLKLGNFSFLYTKKKIS